jgi:hypothetical protein
MFNYYPTVNFIYSVILYDCILKALHVFQVGTECDKV